MLVVQDANASLDLGVAVGAEEDTFARFLAYQLDGTSQAAASEAKGFRGRIKWWNCRAATHSA